MQKTLQFSIILVFFISLNALSANLVGFLADDCKCKNGKCMRACDVENTKLCLNETKVCVCNPEFGMKEDGECEFCDCGEGFNCTFRRIWSGGNWRKICTCPEGYYHENYLGDEDRCKVECSLQRPCQYNGTCLAKRCSCPPYTKGDLCEEVFGCSPQCTLDPDMFCLYDRDKRTPYCGCKNPYLFYDQDANICKPCPCENGYCIYEIHDTYRELKCKCKWGYKEYNGYCKRCWCGYAEVSCDFNSRGEKVCECYEGYFDREGWCQSCDCGINSPCEFIGNVKRCKCRIGKEDVLGKCEFINICEVNNTCPPPSKCYSESLGDLWCECPSGYKTPSGRRFLEPGEVCEDINECEEYKEDCRVSDNVRCVNLPGSYKCECLLGYEPSNYKTNPGGTRCNKTKKSWGPALIVLFTTLAFTIVSALVHVRVKQRANSSN